MAKNKTRGGADGRTPISARNQRAATGKRVKETPFESIAGICAVLAVLLFAQGLVAENMVIPSGSMEPTLLIGDHVVVDRITLAPPAKWMPLVSYSEPRRGDVVVFKKPVPDMVNGKPKYQYLVKRLIAIPGDRLHLADGVVYINGVAQPQGHAQPTAAENFSEFLDDFPAVPPAAIPGETPESWAVSFHDYVKDGNLVVPPGEYFMMGDNRHDSLDSRYWGFVPRANIVGRPLFNYWSFKATDAGYEQTGLAARAAWAGHVALHFFTDTRWERTFHVIE